MKNTTKANIDFKRVIEYDPGNLTKSDLLSIYNHLLLPRVIEDKMLLALRKGRISKWFSGMGQEAIAIGSTLSMKAEEFILPLHRNLGVFTTRGIPLRKLFAQFQGKVTGFTKGRDRSFHFGTQDYNIVGMISHLGPQMAVADGVALADKLSGNHQATLVFTGDGGTSEGDFHEALNVASVWNLPIIFLVENNEYALSTRVKEQFNCKQLADRAKGYGIDGHIIDGNNVLEVYQTLRELTEKVRETKQPVLVECMTFRMRGHEEASGTKYVPAELMDQWAKKDPVYNYQAWLLEKGYLTEEEIRTKRKETEDEIEEAFQAALKDPLPEGNPEAELKDVYLPWQPQKTQSPHEEDKALSICTHPKSPSKKEMRYIDAVSNGLWQSMEHHPNLVLMGQDIAEYGSVFKVTEGFVEKFGKERVRNTPLCESAIVGAGLGLSVKGYKSMIEMQFADFVSCGFNQIVNNLAKSHYRWGQNADVVIRMPTGAGVGGGPFHSQSTEAWFFHTPGLKIVYPSTPFDAKGLLTAAFEDPNPVMYFEHKMLYRSLKEQVYEDYYTIEIGKGRRVQEGDDISIITYGAGVKWAVDAIEAAGNPSVDLIDLRSLLPWDRELVLESVKKTGKALIFHEDTLTGGIGAEIAATISRECFEWLDGPVLRTTALDSPVPFASTLEKTFLPNERILASIQYLLDY